MSSSNAPAASRASAPRPPRSGGFGFKIGRIFGVEVRLDPSLILIFGLIFTTLAFGTLPTWHPDWSTALSVTVAAVAAVAFLASILAHELSHAVVGRALGVPVHGITLFLFGGVASMDRDSDSPRTELLMTIVGPLMSLAIGVVGILGAGLLASSGPNPQTDPETFARKLGPVATILMWLGPVNVLLAVFNMVPGFPLDGGRVLRAGLWWATQDRLKATRWAARAGQWVGFGLMGLGIFMAFGGSVPLLAGGIFSGVWLVLIGWFLSRAARSSYEQLVRTHILEQTPVHRLIRSAPSAVSPETRLSTLMETVAMDADQSSFLVKREDQWLGIVDLPQVFSVPRSEWDERTVDEVMTPAEQLRSVDKEQDAEGALRAMAEQGVDQLPVTARGGAFEGVIRQKDILRWTFLQGQGSPA